MNKNRLVLACIAVFVFVFGYEWVFHGILLKDAYAKTANLWRPDPEMQGYFGWLLLGQFILAVTFCLIYAVRSGSHYHLGTGVGYGFLIGLMRAGLGCITYAVQPVPGSLIGSWFVGGLIEVMLAGAILGAIYRPAVQAPMTSSQAAPA
jgi:hypothetical protein